MTSGYAGKILLVNLALHTIGAIDTARYEEYGGGNGIGSALFWEFCENKAIPGFHPGNVITVMTGPLAGTPVPGSGRMEICGISPFTYPVEWFSRSNIGGFFAAMLKYAGWDGIVIQGRAADPVWINILNDKVKIEDASGLWGLDTFATQEEIWRKVTGKPSFGDWLNVGGLQTTQGPSVICIGPGGERLSRMGTIQSGGGMAAGQGGFGGVWGSKNLKAISVLGTGSIQVANINTLFGARKELLAKIGQQPEIITNGRQSSCSGCFERCKTRMQTGNLSDAQCLDSMFVTDVTKDGKSGSDIVQMHGLNLNDMATVAFTDGMYLKRLYDAGVLGAGKEIDSAPLPMDTFGSAAFEESLCKAIVNRDGIGADLVEGLMRAAAKWGRLDRDLASGLLHKAQWGYGWHWSLPFVEQSYGSLMGDRDAEHCLTGRRIMFDLIGLGEDKAPAEKIINILSKNIVPFDGDPMVFDYTWQEADGRRMKQAMDTGIYSEHKAKLVAWHRYYSRFWVESALLCDTIWPLLLNRSDPEFDGITPETEPVFFNAVTGRKISFSEGMETGRKIWNLNRAIWVLQGRHRDMENFASFMYTPAGSFSAMLPAFGWKVNTPLPVFENGKWEMKTLENMYLDRSGVEHWKTNYYRLEGWDPDTGCPTRSTLEELGLSEVAAALFSLA